MYGILRDQMRNVWHGNCKEITFEQLRDLRIAQNDIINLTATWGM